jgi:hypothetical protein
VTYLTPPPAPPPQAPPPTTVGTFLTDALVTAGVVGIDESIEADVLNKALRISNRMISQWQHERYMVFQLVDYGVVSTGANYYPVGLGQVFNINPRPDRLEYAFLRQISGSGVTPQNGASEPFDWPLEVLDAYEDYAAIRLKTLGTFSNAVFYDPGFPVGRILPWPVPQATIYEIHIVVKQTLSRFINAAQPLIFPPEYEAALEWCLARRYRAAFQLPPDPDINSLAAQGKNIIRKANAQIPTLRFPRELQWPNNVSYNYRSDEG